MNDRFKKFLNLTVKHYLCSEETGNQKKLVAEIVEGGSETFDFMIRVERSRRSAECDEIIDMRGKVPLECKKVMYDSKEFWLDNLSKEILNKNLKKTNGKLTVGVFEDITLGEHTYKGKELKRQLSEELKKRKSRQAAFTQQENQVKSNQGKLSNLSQAKSDSQGNPNKSEFNIDKKYNLQPAAKNPENLPLGYYYLRNNERVQFGSELSIKINNEEFTLRGKDVSIDGIKLVSREKIAIKIDQEAKISFNELNEKEASNFCDIPYQVTSIEYDENKQLIGLKLLHSEGSNDVSQYFSNLIDACLKTSKGRRKLDHEDAVITAESMVSEAIYSQSSSLIPLIITRDIKSKLELVDLCLSKTSRLILDPMIGSNDEFKISYLADPIFLQRVHDLAKGLTDTEIIFSIEAKAASDFVKIYQPDDFDNVAAWLAYVRSRRTQDYFRIFKVEARQFEGICKNKIKQCIGKLASKCTIASQKMTKIFGDIDVVAYLVEITYVYKRMDLSFIPLDHDSSSEVKHMQSNVLESGVANQISYLGYNDSRHEDRYVVELSACILIDDVSYECMTKDISVKGVCLKLSEKSPAVTKGMLVAVGFPSLQKKVKNSINLDRVPYEVMEIDRSSSLSLKLKRVQDVNWQNYNDFFRDLIERNAGKIKLELSDSTAAAKSRLYAAAMSDTLSCIPFSIINNTIKGTKSIKINTPFNEPSLVDYFKLNSSGVDYTPFSVKNRLSVIVKKLANQMSVSLNYYVYKKINQETQKYEFYSTTDIDFKNSIDLISFLGEAIKHDFKIFKFNVSRAERPDDVAINNALDYLLDRSPHNANKIKADIDKVIAIGEIIDVTSIFYEYYSLYTENKN